MGTKNKSNLPADFFTDTGGSNYGLDGYQFNQDYNEGILDQARLPEVAGLGGLPDGIISDQQDHSDLPTEVQRESDAHFDLTEMMKDASLANLDWLDFTSQDPNRLPKQPVDRMVQELTDAWGMDQRTDGLRLLPNRDKEILDYEQSLMEDGHKKQASPEELVRIAKRAMRRSMAGYPLTEIVKEARDSVGELSDGGLLKKALHAIRDEHGLLGKVFIRAASLPNCHNGKWAKTVRDTASNAKYLVAKENCVSCIHNMDNRCATFKKELVDQVPWQEALDHYRPLLRSQGHKVASVGNPKEILKEAFASEIQQHQRAEHKPIVIPEADKISLDQARREFGALPQTKRKVVDRVAQEQEIFQGKVLTQIQKWSQAGLLTKKEATRLTKSEAPPQEVLDAAMSIVAASKKPKEYAGTLFEKFAHISSEEAWKNLRVSEDKAAKEKDQLSREMSKRLEARFVDMQNVGLITGDECQKLIRYAKTHSSKKSLDLAFALVAKKAADPIKTPTQKKADVYQGAGVNALWVPEIPSFSDKYDAAAQIMQRESSQIQGSLDSLVQSGLITQKESQKLMAMNENLGETLKWASALIADRQMKPVVIKKTKEARMFKAQGAVSEHVQLHQNTEEINPLAVFSLLKWAGRHINEGVAGQELDHLLNARFSKPLLKAASVPLKKLRTQHEGAAGYLYVDSSIYASKVGTTGCEEGALKHRTNGIKLVLGMDRCATCVFKNANDTCQKYNKVLIDQIPKEAPQYQEEMIRLANGTDADRIATLFAPQDHSVYEYGVENDNLNDFSFSLTASNEDLGEVLFGGITLGDE